MISCSTTSRRHFLKLAGIASSATIATALFGGCSAAPRTEVPSSSESAASNVSISESSSSSTAVTSSSPSSQTSQSNTASTNNVLVAVFSWSGNTLTMAERINEDIPGSTLFRIEPEKPYSTDYDTVVDQAEQEQQDDTLVPLKNDVTNFDTYSTIFIGYPLWWYHVPQVIKSFMDAHDFNGKTVVPFDTHGGGGWSQSLNDIKEGCTGATILDGLALSGSSINSHLDEVDEWVHSLKIA